MLEMDCHLTHDGFVVVSHDENLLRQTGHDVTISSLNLQVRSRILLDWGKGHKAVLKQEVVIFQRHLLCFCFIDELCYIHCYT